MGFTKNLHFTVRYVLITVVMILTMYRDLLKWMSNAFKEIVILLYFE